jgi:hypothetical protein
MEGAVCAKKRPIPRIEATELEYGDKDVEGTNFDLLILHLPAIAGTSHLQEAA